MHPAIRFIKSNPSISFIEARIAQLKREEDRAKSASEAISAAQEYEALEAVVAWAKTVL